MLLRDRRMIRKGHSKSLVEIKLTITRPKKKKQQKNKEYKKKNTT